MKRLGFIVLAATLMFFFAANPLYARRPRLSCAGLTTENMALRGVAITDQEAVEDEYGAYCKKDYSTPLWEKARLLLYGRMFQRRTPWDGGSLPVSEVF
jgi:hypothetical protein